jgi:hypothetical protein
MTRPNEQVSSETFETLAGRRLVIFVSVKSGGENRGHESRTSHGRISMKNWVPLGPQTLNSLKGQ